MGKEHGILRIWDYVDHLPGFLQLFLAIYYQRKSARQALLCICQNCKDTTLYSKNSYGIWHVLSTEELNYVNHKPNHTASERQNVTKLISKT